MDGRGQPAHYGIGLDVNCIRTSTASRNHKYLRRIMIKYIWELNPMSMYDQGFGWVCKGITNTWHVNVACAIYDNAALASKAASSRP